MRCVKGTARAFALYEVLLGLSIFVIGVLMLGRSVRNCLNASNLSAEEDRVRQILSNRMAEIQATPGFPDESKEARIDTGFGEVRLIQRSVSAGVQTEEGGEMPEIKRVTLDVEWTRGGREQSKRIEFYVYRAG